MSDQIKWTPTAQGLPNSGQMVAVITPDGDERTLRYDSGMWWLPDGSMYVYFVPAFWRPVA